MHRMAKQRADDEGLGRFGEPGVLVLMSLSDGPKHGYGITADILEQTGLRLGPGTLSGPITKLVDRGLIAPLPREDRRQPDRVPPTAPGAPRRAGPPPPPAGPRPRGGRRPRPPPRGAGGEGGGKETPGAPPRLCGRPGGAAQPPGGPPAGRAAPRGGPATRVGD